MATAVSLQKLHSTWSAGLLSSTLTSRTCTQESTPTSIPFLPALMLQATLEAGIVTAPRPMTTGAWKSTGLKATEIAEAPRRFTPLKDLVRMDALRGDAEPVTITTASLHSTCALSMARMAVGQLFAMARQLVQAACHPIQAPQTGRSSRTPMQAQALSFIHRNGRVGFPWKTVVHLATFPAHISPCLIYRFQGAWCRDQRQRNVQAFKTLETRPIQSSFEHDYQFFLYRPYSSVILRPVSRRA